MKNIVNNIKVKPRVKQVIIHDTLINSKQTIEGYVITSQLNDTTKVDNGNFNDYSIENLMALGVQTSSKIDTSQCGSRVEVHSEINNFANSLNSSDIIKQPSVQPKTNEVSQQLINLEDNG